MGTELGFIDGIKGGPIEGIGEEDMGGINGAVEIGGIKGGVGPAGINGFEAGGTRGVEVSDCTPLGTAGGTAGSTCIEPDTNEIESFFLPGGSSSGGRLLGMAYFSNALYTKCMA